MLSTKARVVLAIVLWSLAIGLFLLVAGCAEIETKTVYVPKEVKVVIPSPCLEKEKIPDRPKFALDDPNVMLQSSYKKILAALAELEQRRAYEAQLEALLMFCTK